MHVNVVMGGPSAEYDISILTGIEMVSHLDRRRHAVRAVVISREKLLYACDVTDTLPSPSEFADPASSRRFRGPVKALASQSIWGDCDVALLALHGAFGEDGRFQGFLETIGVPYTGSGVYASAVAMNKIATKFIYEQNGITTPPFSVFGKGHGEVTLESLARDHGFPCFAKCPQSGSSKLMGRAGSKQELADLLALLAQDSEEILVESAVSGIEFSCPVLEQPDGSASALLPVEIRPKTSAFFDYEAKYTDGGSEELVPAPRPQALIERVQQTALKAHTVLGCRGVTRTDIIASGEALYVLEINTLPGFTRNSLVPKSYKAGGGSYEELLELLIRAATRPLSAA